MYIKYIGVFDLDIVNKNKENLEQHSAQKWFSLKFICNDAPQPLLTEPISEKN